MLVGKRREMGFFLASLAVVGDVEGRGLRGPRHQKWLLRLSLEHFHPSLIIMNGVIELSNGFGMGQGQACHSQAPESEIVHGIAAIDRGPPRRQVMDDSDKPTLAPVSGVRRW